jgi:hypothetical protein
MKHQKRLIPSLNVLGDPGQTVDTVTDGKFPRLHAIHERARGYQNVWITPPGMEGTHEIITKEDGAHMRRLDSWGLFRVHKFHGFDQFWHP